MNGLTKERINRNIVRLVEHLIDENQDMIEEVVYEEEIGAKETLISLFEDMAWDELYEDDAPPMSDEYENEAGCAIEKALHDNDKKIDNMIMAVKR